MKKRCVILIFAILFISVFVFALMNNSDDGVNPNNQIKYNSNVCVYKNGELISCSQNLLYDAGKDLIRDYLGYSGGGTDKVDQIEMCNLSAGCTAPQADESETYNILADCGLTKATGTYSALNTGNWTIYHTFTATCDDVITNMTRLRNTAGVNFSGVQFTDVTLQTDDQLLVNWTIWVE